MQNHNQNIGQIGELAAEKFLINQNYEIITRNYRCRFGEIDIVAISRQKVLTFVEVKCRTGTSFGGVSESITYQKRQKLTKTLLHFLGNASQLHIPTWRLDAIFVELDRNRNLKKITQLKNILDG